MRKIILLALVISFTLTNNNAQSVWNTIQESTIENYKNLEREITPEKYTTLSLDMSKLISKLEETELKSKVYKKNIPSLSFPLPDGSIETFKMYEFTSMEPGLSDKFPKINSYVGYAANGSNLILDKYNDDIHVSIWTKKGQVYIDPYAVNSDDYICYYTHEDVDVEGLSTTCGVDVDNVFQDRAKSSSTWRADNISLHTYRLALSCVGEYGGKFASVEAVLANMNTAVNRLNLIFMNELSIKVVLVNDNDKVIFMDGNTDPFSQPLLGKEILTQNTGIINNNVGFNNYDMGHVFTNYCQDIGGVAYLESVCKSNKGGGVTCVPNAFNVTAAAVEITAHEMGHQFGANHTFNNCNGNENLGSVLEPGSGSTIMSYGGLCGPNNIVSVNDDYYHNYSLQEIYQYTRSNIGNSCGTFTDIGNHEPVIELDYEEGVILPISTPFRLTGEATDEDGDEMTYSWEEMDNGPIVPLGQPSGNSPLFRSLYPSSDNTRYFPSLSNVRANGMEADDLLPTYSRNLKFRFIVRDNNPEGGTAVWEQVNFTVTDEAGPFLVTSPNTNGLSYEIGEGIEVTWDVANTNGSKVDAQFVNVYLSDDDGITFPYELATNVPNDGVQSVVLPNVPTTKARIKVAPVNNVFYDMSNKKFNITEPAFGFYFEPLEKSLFICTPDDAAIDIVTSSFGGYDETINFEVISGLPSGANASFEQNDITPGEGTSLLLDLNNVNEGGLFELVIRGSAENYDPIDYKIILDVVKNDFQIFNLSEPLDNAADVGNDVIFSWVDVPDAESYTFEVATNPSFDENSIISQYSLMESSYQSEAFFDINEVFYWRVIAKNRCIDVVSETFVFGTANRTCVEYEADNLPKNISASGKPVLEANFDVSSPSILVDVNIKNVSIDHDYVSDLSASLISPQGTKVSLWHKKCSNLSKINCGFDDDSNMEIDCPMVNSIYTPNQSLSVLNGESIGGRWTIELVDNNSGDGGVFKSAKIELCSNVTFNAPYLVNNVDLAVQPENENIILNSFLKVQDDDNPSDEIIYTLVTVPANGVIRKNNVALNIGESFSQKDIDMGSMSYKNIDGSVENDHFSFIAKDDNGGWLEKTIFNVIIDEDAPNATVELDELSKVNVFPNPTADLIHIDFRAIELGSYHIELLDLNQRVVYSKNDISEELYSMSTEDMLPGIYFIKINKEEMTTFVKICIIK